MSETEGGTRLNKSKIQNNQQMDPQQMQQMQQQRQQQMDPQQMQQMQQQRQQQMDPQQMQQRQQQMDPQQMRQMQQSMDPTILEQLNLKKSSFGKVNNSVLKTSILVSLIFVLLNSKIIWKQIIRLPFMGTAEPSIVALIVNSILAGIIFYIINTIIGLK